MDDDEGAEVGSDDEDRVSGPRGGKSAEEERSAARCFAADNDGGSGCCWITLLAAPLAETPRVCCEELLALLFGTALLTDEGPPPLFSFAEEEACETEDERELCWLWL